MNQHSVRLYAMSDADRTRRFIETERALTGDRIKVRAAWWLMGIGTLVVTAVLKAAVGVSKDGAHAWLLVVLLVIAAGSATGIFMLVARLWRADRRIPQSVDPARVTGEASAPALDASSGGSSTPPPSPGGS
ncbi:hypothetical protein ACIRJS_14315 [Streptomyces sp. NPDC102340]|uniref:hypothetical protein n=1 Tax=unclassified Streptomyces TaxID=2593676 RepID=UPI00380D2C6E